MVRQNRRTRRPGKPRLWYSGFQGPGPVPGHCGDEIIALPNPYIPCIVSCLFRAGYFVAGYLDDLIRTPGRQMVHILEGLIIPEKLKGANNIARTTGVVTFLAHSWAAGNGKRIFPYQYIG